MNDNFDKLLNKKIEESFRELNVTYEPEHWNALQAKIETTEKYYILSPTFMKIAAVFLAGILLSLYYFSMPEKEMPISIYEEIPLIINQTPSELTPIDPQQTPDNNNSLSGNSLKVIQTDQQEESMAMVNPTITNAITLKQLPDTHLFKNAIPPVSVSDDPFWVSNKKISKVEPKGENSILVHRNDIKTMEPEVGILAATNIGFSEAENGTPVGFSAGFASALSLTRKLSLSSGLLVTHQDLQVEETGNEITLESNVGEAQKLTQAKLLTLDIPVNFRYHIKSSGTTRSFLSIGLSSLLYLQQEFNFTTRQINEEVSESENGSVIIKRIISEQQTRSSKPAFSGFDAAGMLNLSFGLQHALSPHSDIVFEPYIKYPLGSLTAENVKYGSGGIQIRLVF